MIDNIKSLNNGRLQFIILNLFDTLLTINGLNMGLVEGNELFNHMSLECFFIGKILLSTIISFTFSNKLLKVLNYVFTGICISNLILEIVGCLIYLVVFWGLIW